MVKKVNPADDPSGSYDGKRGKELAKGCATCVTTTQAAFERSRESLTPNASQPNIALMRQPLIS
jgi:hypothetical protein